MIRNNKHSPILIAGPPRSGTTLIAGLFIKHGVWVGECKVTKYPETNSLIGTENKEIKKFLKHILVPYRNWTLPIPDISRQNCAIFKRTILNRVKTKNRWLVKTSNLLLTWQLWNRNWPEALWIFPRRDIESIVASAKRHPAMKRREKKIKPFAEALLKRQIEIFYKVKYGYLLNVDSIVETKNVHDIFGFCGLDADDEIVNKFIKPEMYHYA